MQYFDAKSCNLIYTGGRSGNNGEIVGGSIFNSRKLAENSKVIFGFNFLKFNMKFLSKDTTELKWTVLKLVLVLKKVELIPVKVRLFVYKVFFKNDGYLYSECSSPTNVV